MCKLQNDAISNGHLSTSRSWLCSKICKRIFGSNVVAFVVTFASMYVQIWSVGDSTKEMLKSIALAQHAKMDLYTKLKPKQKTIKTSK